MSDQYRMPPSGKIEGHCDDCDKIHAEHAEMLEMLIAKRKFWAKKSKLWHVQQLDALIARVKGSANGKT